MKRYVANKSLRDQYIKTWLSLNPEYRERKKVVIGIKLLGVLILGGNLIFWGTGSNFAAVGILIGIGVGAIGGGIPYIIGTAMDIKAANEYSSPFSQREKEYLLISDRELEYGFRNRDNKNEDNLDVYSISAENISAIHVKDNVLIVTGIGNFVSYDDIASKRVNYARSQRKFHENASFYILLDFKERKEIVEMVNHLKKAG